MHDGDVITKNASSLWQLCHSTYVNHDFDDTDHSQLCQQDAAQVQTAHTATTASSSSYTQLRNVIVQSANHEVTAKEAV